MPVTTKLWWKSRTVWAGILEILIAMLLAGAEFLKTGDFSYPAITLFVAGLLMIVLRLLTKQPIA